MAAPDAHKTSGGQKPPELPEPTTLLLARHFGSRVCWVQAQVKASSSLGPLLSGPAMSCYAACVLCKKLYYYQQANFLDRPPAFVLAGRSSLSWGIAMRHPAKCSYLLRLRQVCVCVCVCSTLLRNVRRVCSTLKDMSRVCSDFRFPI